MDAIISLNKIQISGPTLASLIQRVSSAAGDVDGLLFGRVSHIAPVTLSDDSSSSAAAATTSDQPNLIATVTSFFSSTSTSTFYSASGQIDTSTLNNLLSTSDDRLIGWFSGRRKTQLRPSMRESSVTSALASSIQFSSQVQNSTETLTFPPCVFLLLTTPFQDQLIHTHEYKAFQFRSSTDSFDPKTLDVVNLGPAFRGHYGNFITPNSPFPDLSFRVKGLNCESMVEDEGEKEKEKFGTFCDEGFKIGRLKNLMGSDAANYTAELEELYNSMIKKLNGLAKMVEQSSAKVLEQENHNMKLRYKVAGFE
ncbi:hypothetical protein OSB04_021577 [Centaurea solstitialis]|uniref:Uncharacterized protein n=1 Tax=Centaurea solstitialis TaxID=347529 RepID=A0AA38WGD5_9ASTR|nr:hypothetical protein OSB04_021577 [Centaurea solstitialis]